MANEILDASASLPTQKSALQSTPEHPMEGAWPLESKEKASAAVQAHGEAAPTARIHTVTEAATAALALAEAEAAAAAKTLAEAKATTAARQQALAKAMAVQEELQAAEAIAAKTRLQLETLKAMQTSAVEAGETAPYPGVDSVKKLLATAWGSTVEKAPHAWEAARNVTVASIDCLVANKQFVLGTILSSTMAGAVASLLPVPAKAAYCAGTATTIAAMGSMLYEDGRNSLTSLVKSAGEFNHPGYAGAVAAGTAFVSALEGVAEASAQHMAYTHYAFSTYGAHLSSLEGKSNKVAATLASQWAEQQKQFPSLFAMQQSSVQNALRETVKNALIGAASAATIVAVTELVQSARAWLSSNDHLAGDDLHSDAAAALDTAPVNVPDPVEPHEPATLTGFMQEAYA